MISYRSYTTSKVARSFEPDQFGTTAKFSSSISYTVTAGLGEATYSETIQEGGTTEATYEPYSSSFYATNSALNNIGASGSSKTIVTKNSTIAYYPDYTFTQNEIPPITYYNETTENEQVEFYPRTTGSREVEVLFWTTSLNEQNQPDFFLDYKQTTTQAGSVADSPAYYNRPRVIQSPLPLEALIYEDVNERVELVANTIYIATPQRGGGWGWQYPVSVNSPDEFQPINQAAYLNQTRFTEFYNENTFVWPYVKNADDSTITVTTKATTKLGNTTQISANQSPYTTYFPIYQENECGGRLFYTKATFFEFENITVQTQSEIPDTSFETFFGRATTTDVIFSRYTTTRSDDQNVEPGVRIKTFEINNSNSTIQTLTFAISNPLRQNKISVFGGIHSNVLPWRIDGDKDERKIISEINPQSILFNSTGAEIQYKFTYEIIKSSKDPDPVYARAESFTNAKKGQYIERKYQAVEISSPNLTYLMPRQNTAVLPQASELGFFPLQNTYTANPQILSANAQHRFTVDQGLAFPTALGAQPLQTSFTAVIDKDFSGFDICDPQQYSTLQGVRVADKISTTVSYRQGSVVTTSSGFFNLQTAEPIPYGLQQLAGQQTLGGMPFPNASHTIFVPIGAIQKTVGGLNGFSTAVEFYETGKIIQGGVPGLQPISVIAPISVAKGKGVFFVPAPLVA
jgi:hypothetical protein